ncbi:SAV_2336 N-terminal domain-related protein [Streptomyces sp. NPDC017520]|uniref:SAV_2336 N-terminal domain-related protein n=1 Tax=Streptomyces sp. NPDC017520 TaxID=3364998 RepID=UPI00379D4812
MTGRPELGRIRRALAAEGEPLDAEELLDVLWLAARLPPCAATALARVAALAEPPAVVPAHQDADDPTPFAAPLPGHDARSTATTDGEPLPVLRPARETGLHAAPVVQEPPARSDRSAMAVRAPGVKALGGAELRLGRALRPLKQMRPDFLRSELDVDATVTAMAETGLPEAVLRPATTRWLDLTVLVDDGVSMLLWQGLAGELRRLLERCGAFRQVRVHGLDTRGPTGPRLRSRPYGASAAALPLSAVLDPAGNTLLLVMSDGVGGSWRDGSMHEALLRTASAGPTAVVHTLPRRLWAGTGIDTRSWRVTARRRGAANRSWHIEDPLLPPELAPFDGVPVPVLATDGDAVGTWARLVGSPGETAVLPLLTLPSGTVTAPDQPRSPHRDRTGGAREAVTRFRESASADAYRLAAHLASVAPLPVPVMRIVQHAVTPAVDTSHLVEVFLGGLMRSADETERPPHQRTFDFTEETRQILLGTVPPAELVRTTRRVTDHLSELSSSSADFPAWLPHPGGADRVSADSRRPFGWVGETLLRRLGVSPPDVSQHEAPPRSPELRPLPPGLALDLDATRWRGLTVSDQRFEGRSALPYDVFAEYGPVESGVFLAHDGEGRLLVIRRLDGEPDAHNLIATEVLALQRMNGSCAPLLMAWEPDHERPWHAVLCSLDEPSQPAPNLHDFTTRHGLLHHAGLLAVARQLADGLARAHELRLVHGALTSGRVLIAGRDAQILGWLTASVDDVDSRYWSVHRQHPRYRAPELNNATEGPSREADVYALGAVLVEAAVGQGYYGGPADALEAARETLEPAFIGLLRACLQDDPARRPTALQLRQALDSLAHRETDAFTIALGFDAELNSVRLDLRGESGSGNGPHLLCQGRPARVRRDLLLDVLEQISRQAGDGVRFLLADYDDRSGFDRFAQRPRDFSFLGLRRGGTDVLTLGDLLRRELRRRENFWSRRSTSPGTREVSEQDRPPHLVVAVDDFPRVHRLAPELHTALREVVRAGGRLGIHLVMSADDMELVATDDVSVSLCARVDLLSRTVEGGAPSLDGAVLHIPSGEGPIHFATGYESTTAAHRPT